MTEAVARLKRAGLKVVTVICDQGATNMQMFRMFDASKDKPHAVIDGDIAFFYVPSSTLAEVCPE